MIKLFSLKQQKKEGEGAKSGTKRASAAQLRLQKGAARVNITVLCHIILLVCAKKCVG